MGLCGKYLDALSDEQRDRVIEAVDIHDGLSFFSHGCACLVGTTEMVDLHDTTTDPINQLIHEQTGRIHFPSSWFPILCRRFGKARIVRLCKARAAKANRIHIGQRAKAEIDADLKAEAVR